MSKTPKNVAKSISGTRARAAVIAAGLGVSVALGAGSAVAAQATGQGDVFSSGTASKLAESARHQADQQHQAAASAKKEAQERAEKERASREAERKKLNSWTKPVEGSYDLSAGFGNSGGRWANKHSGQDFAVPTGTQVKSVHGGTVVKAGPNGAGDGSSYGNAVVIKHDDNTYSQYAHLDSLQVKPG
ncbi:MAG: M23 family metallopeptidase, partial [Streptomyces sp.]